MSVYRHVSAEEAMGYSVSMMCELLEVSRPGYCGWAGRAPSDRELSDAWLTARICVIDARNKGR